ncbi:imidazolonepropionase [Salmonella bongori]|nr:imidazolonepropionase [Salmonella bongori]
MICRDGLVTPGLIDCHTHLIFAGNRADEWEQRLNGVSYQHISAQGGGIQCHGVRNPRLSGRKRSTCWRVNG